MFQQCLLLLLALLFLVRGIDDTDASTTTVQPLSTGETPMAFVQNKIDTHDVSSSLSPKIVFRSKSRRYHLYGRCGFVWSEPAACRSSLCPWWIATLTRSVALSAVGHGIRPELRAPQPPGQGTPPETLQDPRDPRRIFGRRFAAGMGRCSGHDGTPGENRAMVLPEHFHRQETRRGQPRAGPAARSGRAGGYDKGRRRRRAVKLAKTSVVP